MLYNPFEQVTKNSFRELVESGYVDFVLQRLEWPDVKEKTGFLLRPYDDKEAADQHAHQLGAKEGRALQLPQDADKIESLLTTGSGYRIFLHTDIEIIKKTFPQLRDERRQLDYNYDYLENVQAITFPKYPTLYKDKDSSQLALTEMEWGVLPTYIDGPKLQADRRRNINEEDMPPIFLFEMPNEKLRHYPVYT
ncbi:MULTISPECIES: hypothetical protein [unclassified Sphingobacterium]|uniref:hypothetical protein n=1 Tax=unclassified Sphingobacterium TaxID=2609468 RepID=UPI0025D6899F|nr:MULTISPECIES: hypothetical protein [unclassified Sphingobacterium]